jgi:hypothetical protein
MKTYILKVVYFEEKDADEKTIVSRVNAALNFTDGGDGQTIEIEKIGEIE